MFVKRTLVFVSVLLNSVSAFEQKKLLCSSENMEMWYSYRGGMYYLSASITPCFYGMQRFNVSYTIIPLFQFRHISFSASIWHKKKKWFEKNMNDLYCPDYKLCNILKGETLHDTIQYEIHHYSFPKGVYEIFIEVINLDSIVEESLQFNITAVVR